MNFRHKIWSLPLSAAGIFVVGCVVSYVAGARTSDELESLRGQAYPALETMARIEHDVENFRLTLQAIAAEGDDSRLSEADDLGKTMLAGIDQFGAIPGQQTTAGALRAQAAAYQAAAIDATRTMLAKAAMGDKVGNMQRTMAALDKSIGTERDAVHAAVTRSQNNIASGLRHSLLIVLGTCVAALVALAAVSRRIVTSVWRELGDEPSRLRDKMRAISDGDLVLHDSAQAHPESISAGLAGMTDRLRRAMGAMREASSTIAGASSDIAAGNQDLSTRTEQTSANLQQAASALEQLTSTVGHTAEAALQARDLAAQAAQAAQRGSATVEQVIVGMDEIHGASRRITEITSVIDGIAFQTNILALNAAVESARAGEHGRGFAVVANEVRTLAQRSANAAREIKALIDVSGAKVESGSRLVGDAGTAMRDILAGISQVSAVVTEISTATSEQSQGIANVNSTVSQLDEMTQRNAALVEESAAASGSLREQAARLASEIGVFRVERH